MRVRRQLGAEVMILQPVLHLHHGMQKSQRRSFHDDTSCRTK